MKIAQPNQVWAADITYIPMRKGFMFLFAIIDWYFRKIIGWELSTTLDIGFCLKCLKRTLKPYGAPQIINTDQGSHLTSEQWRECVQGAGIRMSMDGRGRRLQKETPGQSAEPGCSKKADLQQDSIRCAIG